MDNLVSVIIPTYNRENFIEKSIESVLNQTYKNIEIIIVDDNSSDNTFYIIKKYMEKYDFIKYVKHDINKGGSAARNTGVNLAKGKYVAFLDSDDEWINTKLEKCVDKLKCDCNIDMVYSDMISIDVNTGIEKIYRSKQWEDKYYGILCENIIGSTSLIVIKRNVFNEVGGFKEGLPSCQDWDFYINVCKNYRVEKVNEPLLRYYIHSNSISGNLNRVIEGHNLILNKVKKLLENDNKYNKERNIIISKQNIIIARIYRKFNDFNMAKKYYFKSLQCDFRNKEALKNLFPMLLGKTIYYKLRSKY